MIKMRDWTRRYRSRWEGSFPGTGPMTYNGTTYFTDNTFAVYLSGRTFKLFARNLESESVKGPYCHKADKVCRLEHKKIEESDSSTPISSGFYSEFWSFFYKYSPSKLGSGAGNSIFFTL